MTDSEFIEKLGELWATHKAAQQAAGRHASAETFMVYLEVQGWLEYDEDRE